MAFTYHSIVTPHEICHIRSHFYLPKKKKNLRILLPFTFSHTHVIKYSSLTKFFLFFCFHKKILVCSLLYTIVIIPPRHSYRSLLLFLSVCVWLRIYIHINSQLSFLCITLWNIHKKI